MAMGRLVAERGELTAMPSWRAEHARDVSPSRTLARINACVELNKKKKSGHASK